MERFRVIDRVCPAEHIREYPRATAASQEEQLHLAIKQYVPLDNPSPQPGDLTILAAHANGFCKELYEPLWDDLHEALKQHGVRIRSIWMADVAHQGASYRLNEDKVGDDPHYHDHARDLLHMINTYREHFPRPIMGIGHSMGSDSLMWLSTMHPRLISALALLEPIFSQDPAPNIFALLKATTRREEVLPSMGAAQHSLRKSPLLRSFDPRVTDRMLNNTFRHLPTFLHPQEPPRRGDDAPRGGEGADGPVTYVTPKHQQGFSMVRPNYRSRPSNAPSQGFAPSREALDSHPDVAHPFLNTPFYVPSSIRWRDESWVHSIRPPVLFLSGSKSPYSLPHKRAYRMEHTGTGQGGSGGARVGRVREHLLEGYGHFLCFEDVGETARVLAGWLGGEKKDWEGRERRSLEGNGNGWLEKDARGRQMADQKWADHINKLDRTRGAENMVQPSTNDGPGTEVQGADRPGSKL